MISYSFDLTKCAPAPAQALPFGGTSPDGRSVSVNSRCFLRDGQPWFPLMGEFHFTRTPKERWRDELLKCRAGGISVVATYVFWIHHEEEEGIFRWDGQRDLRTFVSLCKEVGLSLFLRVGPWAHGECRNGGFPDWLMTRGCALRQDDPEYLALVRRFWEQVELQVRGLLFADGGPVIGIQLENEYGHAGGCAGEQGHQHMHTLRRMLDEVGLKAPLYTATAWGGAIVNDGEELPLLGGYVEAPWSRQKGALPANPNYLFVPYFNDHEIAADFIRDGKTPGITCDVTRYPFATAELGAGLMPTHHRRIVVTGDDTEAMILSKLASGVSLLGYYMYHGGVNPVGRTTTLQESRASGGYNDYPAYGYDFQAPLGEFGQEHGGYRPLKRLHQLIESFPDLFAGTRALLCPDNALDAEDTQSPRLSVRAREGAGFVFINNYQRQRVMTEKEYALNVETPDGTIRFPSFTIPDGGRLILPFGLSLDGVRLDCALAQPVSRASVEPDVIDWYFFSPDYLAPEFSLSGCTLERLANARAEVMPDSVRLFGEPGKTFCALVRAENGQLVRITCLPAANALDLFLLDGGTPVFTGASLMEEKGGFTLLSRTREISFRCPAAKSVSVSGAVLGEGEPDETGLKTVSVELTPACGSVSFSSVPAVEPGARRYAVELESAPQDALDELFLRLDWTGSEARLYQNGVLCCDTYYVDGVWEIGLSRFGLGKALSFELELIPARESDGIFFDRPPRWIDGASCALKNASLQPEYRLDVTLR